jgi:hypothetical protein
MKTKSQLSSMLFFVCLGCPASQPKDIEESKNNVSESSVSPATTPIEPNKSTYDEPQKVAPAPTPVKDVKNNDNLKTAGIIGAGALGIGALYLAHKKLTTKAQQDLENLTHNNPNPQDLKNKSKTILDNFDQSTKVLNDQVPISDSKLKKEVKDFYDYYFQDKKFKKLVDECKNSLEVASPGIYKIKEKNGFSQSNWAANNYFNIYQGKVNRYLDRGALSINPDGKYYYNESPLLKKLGSKFSIETIKEEIRKLKTEIQTKIQETDKKIEEINNKINDLRPYRGVNLPNGTIDYTLSLKSTNNGLKAVLEMIENL